MMITISERALLIAIRDNEFNDGLDPVDNEVWVDCVDVPGMSSTSKGGVMASLVKKCLAYASGHGNDATCCINQAGFDIIKDS